MGFKKKLVEQCRKPTGWWGRLVARGMNRGHAHVTKWGLSHVPIAPTATCLDVGCGGGETVRRLARAADAGMIHGLDYSADCVKLSRRHNKRLVQAGRVQIHHGSVSAVDALFPADTFNMVTAVETVYFWPDLVADLRKVRTVLKPGGTVILVGEVYRGLPEFEERNARWAELGHFTYYAIDEMRAFLDQAGYTRVQVHERPERNWFAILGGYED